MSKELDDILQRFNGVRRLKKDSYQCQCPCHDDQNASLTISQAQDKILMHCHAGCATEDILAATGLTLKDLCEGADTNPTSEWRRDLEATYDYISETGEYLYSKLRYKGKKIVYARICEGDIVFGKGDNEKALYRLPEVIKAVAAKEIIYIPEGEKDVETLRSLGLSAVTPGGVNDWQKKFAKHFKDAWVVLLPDNDEPGRKLMERIEKDIKNACYCYKTVITSQDDKGDVTDYLREGHSKEDLIALVEKEPWICKDTAANPGKNAIIPLECYTAKALGLMDLQPPDFIVKDFLPVGVSILAAPSKIGKSWLAMDLSLSVTEGKPFLGYQTNRADVFYLALEDSLFRLKNRMDKLQDYKPDGLFIATKSENMVGGFIEQLNLFLKDHEEIKLVIIDTFQRVKPPAEKYGTAYEVDYRVLGQFKELVARYNVGILLVHHTRKGNGLDGDPFEKILGSTALQGATDTMYVLTKVKRTDETATLAITGRDVQQKELIVRFDKDSCRWLNEGDAEVIEEERQRMEYESDPIILTIRVLLKDSDYWEGSLEELRMAVSLHARKVIPETGKALSAKLSKLAPLLAHVDNIQHSIGNNPVKKNGKSVRLHSFKKYYPL